MRTQSRACNFGSHALLLAAIVLIVGVSILTIDLKKIGWNNAGQVQTTAAQR